MLYIHLTLVPYIGPTGELKTKPTQHSVNELRRIGIAPDMLMCRSEGALSQEIRKKIALFASLPPRRSSPPGTSRTSTRCRSSFARRGSDEFMLEHFGLQAPAPELSSWSEPIERAERAQRTVTDRAGGQVRPARGRLPVGLARRCATPAGMRGAKVHIDWVDSEHLESGDARAPS